MWCFVNSRTSFEQRGSISINGVGSLVGGMMEAFGQTFLQRGANKVTLLFYYESRVVLVPHPH